MMEMTDVDIYQDQADYYSRLPLVMPELKGCVHLENEDDIPFWNAQIQKVSPGQYQYITHSKSSNGKDTSGCEQCLRYRPYVNKHFFVCIDSDLRDFSTESEVHPSDYIAQTYTYSWENHCCESINLNAKVLKNSNIAFNFNSFLSQLSSVLYEPLIYLIFYSQTDNTAWNISKFNRCIPTQVRRVELAGNGMPIISKIQTNFSEAMASLHPEQSKICELKERCSHKGLTQANAYLHIQGHVLYNLVAYIGKLLCKGLDVMFEDILKDFRLIHSYDEINKVSSDLNYILKS